MGAGGSAGRTARDRGSSGAAAPAHDLSELRQYVAMISPALRLSDWQIELVEGDVGDDSCAQTDAPYAQRRGTVTLGPVYFQQTPEEQRDTIVHELLHLVLMPAWQYVEHLLDDEIPGRSGRIAWHGFVQQAEYAVDHLAGLIAPTLPLPPAAAEVREESAEPAGEGPGEGGAGGAGEVEADSEPAAAAEAEAKRLDEEELVWLSAELDRAASQAAQKTVGRPAATSSPEPTAAPKLPSGKARSRPRT